MKRIQKFIASFVASAMLSPIMLPLANVTYADTLTGEGVLIDEESFPDGNFRSYVSTNIDVDNDGYLSDEEIAEVDIISVNSKSISSLEGVEYFYNLWGLYCEYNQLTNLDLSANINLLTLSCDYNQLTNLDLSANTKLKYLNCHNNQLTSLDVSECTNLQELSCVYNQLTSLDVSNNSVLSVLNCEYNELTSLDVDGCTALEYIYCHNNELTSLDVSGCTNLQLLDCNYNQLTSLDVRNNINLQDLSIIGTDIEVIDISNNQILLDSISGGTLINADHLDDYGNNFSFYVFRGVYVLSFNDNQGLILEAGKDPFYPAEETPEPVEVLLIDEESFPDDNFRSYVSTNIDVDGDGYLSDDEIALVTRIFVDSQSISSLEGVENFHNLETLSCTENQLTALDVSGCTALVSLTCYDNQLIDLDVTGCNVLESIWCYNNQLTSLDVSGCSALEFLHCGENQLTSLDVRACVVLESLECSFNQLTSLDVSNNAALKELMCDYNQLTSLYVSGCAELWLLVCTKNQLTSIDISGCDALDNFYFLHDANILIITPTPTLTPTPIGLRIDEESFPDSVFRNYICINIDTDENGYLSDYEIARVTGINASCISSLEGIEYFYNLRTLYCGGPELTSLDLSGCTALESLWCTENPLTSLDISACVNLKSLICSSNQLTSLDISNNTALEYLDCGWNQITSLDVSRCNGLKSLSCSGNRLTSLDVSGCTALWQFFCDRNQLTSLDVSGCVALITLCCYDNELTSLDVSECVVLNDLYCSGNQFTSLDVSRCTELEELSCAYNPITSLDVSNNTSIRYLDIRSTDFDVIDISNNPSLLYAVSEGELVKAEFYYGDNVFGYKCQANYYLLFSDNHGFIFNPGQDIYYPAEHCVAPSPTPNIEDVENFVDRLYYEVFGREADQGGVNYWVSEICNGTSGGDAARIFLFSEEFLNKEMTDEEFVEVLYAVFFDRTPDAGGLNYWAGEVASKGKENVINSLIGTQEWANTCASYGIATGASNESITDDPIVAFAERLYSTCFEREGDQNGINYWAQELREGRKTGSEVARLFFFSDEFTNAGYGNDEFVTRLYRLFFNREPDAGGLNYWVGKLDSDTSRLSVFRSFTGCQEWLDACSAAGIQP